MDNHPELFKESNTSLGTFYPTHYIAAGYHTLDAANAAARACEEIGFQRDEVRVLDGDYVTRELESREGSNWLERLGQLLAEFAGTEVGYLYEDADLARTGGAFLFVYAPDDARVGQARRVFASHGPAYARRYLKIAIEILIENPNAP